jgi:hypothetical protein
MNEPPNDYLPDPQVKGRLYVHLTDGTFTLWAMEMDTTFAIHTKDGIEQGRSGDYLCKSRDGDLGRWARLDFQAAFKLVDDRPVLPPQVVLSENDPDR